MALLNHKKNGSKWISNWRIWLILSIVFVLAGGGFIWWRMKEKTAAKADEAQSTLQTARVKRGDLRIFASGSGELVAGTEANLSFAISGTVGELDVQVGDQVSQGQVLACLADQNQLESAVASNELALLQIQQALEAQLENADVALAETYRELVEAQGAYEDAQFDVQRKSYARCSQEVNTNNNAQLERAREELERLNQCCYGSEEWIDAKNNYDTALANWNYCAAYTEQEVIESQASLELAEAQLKQAQDIYDELKGNSGLDSQEFALTQAELKEAEISLALAEEELEGADIVSPMDGTVISIAASVGEVVDNSTYIIIADLSTLYVEIFVDETDLEKLALGNPVEVIFDALPNEVFTGEVIQVNPELVDMEGYQVAKGLAFLDSESMSVEWFMPLGLNASVNVISAEIEGALLVPVEALRNIGDEEYALFVLDEATSELKMRLVEVGLIDYTYAEIRNGVFEGELVSTGIVQTGE